MGDLSTSPTRDVVDNGKVERGSESEEVKFESTHKVQIMSEV